MLNARPRAPPPRRLARRPAQVQREAQLVAGRRPGWSFRRVHSARAARRTSSQPGNSVCWPTKSLGNSLRLARHHHLVEVGQHPSVDLPAAIEQIPLPLQLGKRRTAVTGLGGGTVRSRSPARLGSPARRARKHAPPPRARRSPARGLVVELGESRWPAPPTSSRPHNQPSAANRRIGRWTRLLGDVASASLSTPPPDGTVAGGAEDLHGAREAPVAPRNLPTPSGTSSRTSTGPSATWNGPAAATSPRPRVRERNSKLPRGGCRARTARRSPTMRANKSSAWSTSQTPIRRRGLARRRGAPPFWSIRVSSGAKVRRGRQRDGLSGGKHSRIHWSDQPSGS